VGLPGVVYFCAGVLIGLTVFGIAGFRAGRKTAAKATRKTSESSGESGQPTGTLSRKYLMPGTDRSPLPGACP
jgi:hypothetical protein